MTAQFPQFVRVVHPDTQLPQRIFSKCPSLKDHFQGYHNHFQPESNFQVLPDRLTRQAKLSSQPINLPNAQSAWRFDFSGTLNFGNKKC